MHTINDVTDYDFSRLQKYAEPLVDTAATALTKVLDLLEGIPSNDMPKQQIASSTSRDVKVYKPGAIPPLTHTKLMAAEFAGKSPEKASWDAMVRLALACLKDEFDDLKMVRGSSGANLVSGQKTNEGYRYLPDLGFSYQGVSAEDACEIIIRSARALNVDAWVDFVWRDKPEAHKPGEAGRIEV